MYDRKPKSYFANARHDIVAKLPEGCDSILEVGCGAGGTGELALQSGRCTRYDAVELFNYAAETAQRKLTQVVVGDVEEVDLPWEERTFNALIMSEVLEHLRDPEATLQRLVPLLKAGAVVFASSPNVSQRRVIKELIRGNWPAEDKGVFDRTHLRWFTPRTYQAMFENAGLVVDEVGPLPPIGPRGRLLNLLTGSRFSHVTWGQINLKAHKP